MIRYLYYICLDVQSIAGLDFWTSIRRSPDDVGPWYSGRRTGDELELCDAELYWLVILFIYRIKL